MKKTRFYVLAFCLLVLITGTVLADATSWDIKRKPNEKWLSGSVGDPAWNWMKAIDKLVSLGPNPGTGSIYYVDSGVTTEGNGTSWENAKNTVDEAINLCTASAGDVIFVAQGHAESFSAANGFDADIAGITIIMLGNKDNAPTFTFANTGATIAVGKSGVRIVGGRYLAGVSEVVMGISVEGTADDIILDGLYFPEPSVSTYEFDKSILVASGADRVTIKNCIAYSADATGATNFIDLDSGVNNGTKIINNIIHGEYEEGAIHSDKADLETLVLNNNVTNMTSGQHAIEFTAAATGICAFNIMYTDAEATSLDPGSMKCIENYVVTAIDASGVLFPARDDTAQNLIGYNDNDNAADTSTIVSNADGSVLERLEFLQTEQSGSYILVQSDVTSSSIPNNTQTAGAITGVSSGALLLINIYANTDSTGLAGPTNFEFSVNNTNGLTGAAGPFAVEQVAGLGASLCWNAETDATSNSLPLYLETGKKVFIHGDDGAGTGTGHAYITMVFQRVTDGATIAGNDGPS